MDRFHTAHDGGPTGSHSHADQPNWRPAVTADDYLRNVHEGLEVFSERRLAKLMGVSRITLWRWQQKSAIPPELFELLIKTKHSNKSMAAIGTFFSGANLKIEKELCPHCGDVVRIKGSISKEHETILRDWFKRHG